jgi:hypothetical protein
MSRKEFECNTAKNFYLENLDRGIWRFYPRMEDAESDLYTWFKSGLITFASFNINNNDPDFRRKILETTLMRAADPYDKAFCAHGSNKHDDFYKAIQVLLSANGEGELYIRNWISPRNLKKVSPEANYIISSPWMKQGSKVFRATAILLSLQTVANSYSTPNLHWRLKSRYILENYYNFSTTRVLSAYLKNEQ